jgi:diketogulonate reductase-like aldo/keto reductase
MSVIPKASSRAHLAENMDVFGWTLGPEEMAQIDAIAP